MKRLPVILGAMVVLALGLAGCSGDERSVAGVSVGLVALQERIGADAVALGREGIYLAGTARREGRCVVIDLVNPTRPNREYLRRRYGSSVCISPEARSTPLRGCTGLPAPTPEGRARKVPDVVGMRLHDAQRAIVRAGLTFAVACEGDAERRVPPLDRSRPEAVARVTHQCPARGERAAEGSQVRLAASADLPGGFTYNAALSAEEVRRCRR